MTNHLAVESNDRIHYTKVDDTMDKIDNVLIVDLDGTLCDCNHRVHLAQAKEWDEFHKGIPEDKLIQTTADMVKLYADAGFIIIGCTGRDERQREATEKWLTAHGMAMYFDKILMRAPMDWRSDHIVKPDLLRAHFGSIENALSEVHLILDDRDGVVEAFRNLGFTVWQVNAGQY